MYRLVGLTSAEGTIRNLTLTLNPDSSARLEIEFVGIGSLVERGKWNGTAHKVHVLWTELEGERIHLRMEFEGRGQALVLSGPDLNIFGASDIVFHRVTPDALL